MGNRCRRTKRPGNSMSSNRSPLQRTLNSSRCKRFGQVARHRNFRNTSRICWIPIWTRTWSRRRNRTFNRIRMRAWWMITIPWCLEHPSRSRCWNSSTPIRCSLWPYCRHSPKRIHLVSRLARPCQWDSLMRLLVGRCTLTQWSMKPDRSCMRWAHARTEFTSTMFGAWWQTTINQSRIRISWL